ncbi:hypothetical protein BVC80_9079g15 [Macleaya cordata]|uniref:WRKY19-like zinc finger domain-containing protein n=1 Tax=Macleaya cordata TaxID=56857 RepID=A0A200PUJ9_MACCD|nr:hypothetical protein BVC80_9079g15 [Macleaya cordata]
MDTGFQHFKVTANSSSNVFDHLSKVNQVGVAGTSACTDTVLQLDSPGASSFSYLSDSKGFMRKWSVINGSKGSEDGYALALGLGHSPSSSDSKGSLATVCTTTSSAKEIEKSAVDLSLDFHLPHGNEKNYYPKKYAGEKALGGKKPMFDLNLPLSTESAESSITSVNLSSVVNHSNLEMPFMVNAVPSHTLHKTNATFVCTFPGNVDPVPTVPDLSSTMETTLKSSVTCSSELSQQQQHNNISKICKFKGCGKGARGASGLCIAHGGGRRCQKAGCQKGAEGRTVYCKAHGGGRRCQYLGCTKSAEGRTDYCIAHGGGRRCNHEGCTRAARGKSGLCIRHGGGKRCQKENCTKSAEGLSGLCISHGGGRRCQFPECTKGAQGSTMFCKAHGGGRRCTVLGCTKGAEGSTHFCKGHGGGKRCSFKGGGVCPKSVHGGTLFCVAHGGGKRCVVLECTKSARGRTDFCVRHGGGKRCKFEGCGKSAQGSTDFCKAHGGGKRCSWGQLGTEYAGQDTSPCDRFARGKTGLCAAHNALVQDKCVHGGGTLRPTILDPKLGCSGKMKDVVTVEDMNVDVLKMGIGGNFAGCSSFNSKGYGNPASSLQLPPQVQFSMDSVSLPEGRVHGGGLIALLAGSSVITPNSENQAVSGQSVPGTSYVVPPHNRM